VPNPIGSMYGIYANIGGILMVNVTIYSIHGSYGNDGPFSPGDTWWTARPRDRLKSTSFDGDSVVLFFLMIPLFVRPTSRSLKSLGQPISTAHHFCSSLKYRVFLRIVPPSVRKPHVSAHQPANLSNTHSGLTSLSLPHDFTMVS